LKGPKRRRRASLFPIHPMALVEGCKHELAFTIPQVDVAAEIERVVAEYQKQARLPGFRPGKAPASMIRSRFGNDIRQKVLENLIPRALGERFRQENLNVVGRPEIKDLKFEKDAAIEFKAEFEVAPEIELGEYIGIEAPYSEASATDEEVDQRIEQLRDQKAQFVNEEPRPARDGDFAVVSLESFAGVDPAVKNGEMTIQIADADTFPAFTAGLRGMTPGETRDIEVEYPADYGEEKLAGKTVKFHVTLKQLRRKELPELDDDFAQELGDFQTVEELRNAVRAAITREKEAAAQQAARTAILDKLVDAHDFPVPETYIDRQIESQAETYLRSLAAQGVDLKDVKLDWNKLRESQKERAARDVKASLLLDKIAEREAIVATQEDVDREIQRIARAEREPPAAVRLRLEKSGGLNQLAARIRTEKTLQFLFDKSRKVAG
jgi:trigger factor